MAAVPTLEAVPVPDMIIEDQGRNYSYMFNFEQEFEHSVVRLWMEDNWQGVCTWASIVYLLLIFGGQSLMANREPFQLRGPLTVWNMLLAVFSIMGAARTLPEFIHTFSTQGFHHSLCVPSFIERDRVSGFWTWMFVLSKVPELGDTIFIVLRKQRLIFLHWYHHVTVLIYCWYSFSEYTAPARWFVVMNFVVHSLMYTYYAFRALRFRVPRCIAMVITSLQLVQMVVGCLVNTTAYMLKRRGVQCGVSDTNLQLSLLMYTSYFVLFARFFYNTYFKKRDFEKKVLLNASNEKIDLNEKLEKHSSHPKEQRENHRNGLIEKKNTENRHANAKAAENISSTDMISRKTLSEKVETDRQCTKEEDGSYISKETNDETTQQKIDNSPASKQNRSETSESPVESEKKEVKENPIHNIDEVNDNKDHHLTRKKSGADLKKHTEETKESLTETETGNATEEKLKGTK